MDARTLIEFLDVMERMKDNTRHSWTSGGRHESVAEHSWRTALMALLIKDEFAQADIDKVIRMCLLHDIGEAVTGDIPAFEKTQGDETTEQQAIDALLDSLPAPWPQELRALFAEMDAQETPEAKIYKALDRLEAVLQHNEADVSTWLPLEYDLNLTYGVKEAQFSPYLAGLREEIRRDTLEKMRAAEDKRASEE